MIRILTGLLCTLLLSTGAALAQTRDMSSSGVALDRVIAIVNEGVVLQSQLETQSALIADRLQAQGSQLPPADVIRQQVLERLILQEIQVQRAGRLGVQVPDEMLNEALRDVAKRNNIEFEQMPRDARAAGRRLRDLPRGDAPRNHAVDAAPARRVPAHLRLAARGGTGTRTRREPGRRQHRVRRLPHPAFAAGIRDDRRDGESRGDGARRPQPRDRKARISASSRSPTRRRSPRSSAASSAGAAWASCRSSSATSS